MVDVAFYGDDFTGSTDALLQFHRFGLRGILCVDLPGVAAEDYDVVGVAGIARSLATPLMDDEIRPVLTAFRDLKPRIVQYKMCSTADSSPALGSLGRAIEIGQSVYDVPTVPVLAAQPELGRYTVFGNHFAVERGTIYRLDRQPTVANHPATPMIESDLRVHLGAQTALPISSIDITEFDSIDECYRDRSGIVVFDALAAEHLCTAARAILARPGPVFAVGSGGLSYGLAAALTGRDEPLDLSPPAPIRHALAVCGSQSGQTAIQIRTAVRQGWAEFALTEPAIQRRAIDAFATAPGVIVHSGSTAPVDTLGRHFAEIIRAVVDRTDIRRVIVAGGDTSGRVVRELGVRALELQSGIGSGAALCRAIAPNSTMDGIELALKGGQVGAADFFETTRTGSPSFTAR